MKKKKKKKNPEKKKKKKAYLKPYYFDIFLKKGKTLKHPKEGEEREEFLLFFWRREERAERERSRASRKFSHAHYFLRARSFSCRASFIAFVHRVVRTLFCHHPFRLQRREGERVKAKNVTRRNRGPRRGKRKGREGKKFDPTRFRFGIEPIVFCT